MGEEPVVSWGVGLEELFGLIKPNERNMDYSVFY